MTSATFSQEAIDSLIGKAIIDIGSNYVVLDNGIRIYIEESEIEMLNN